MMNQKTEMVEFRMVPSVKDCSKATMYLLVRRPVFWIYTVAIIAALIIMEIIARLKPQTEDPIAVIAFIAMLMLILPFVICGAWGRVMHTLYPPSKDKIYFLNCDGYGIKFGKSIYFTEWQRFERIVETGNYVFLKMRKGRNCVIFKSLLSKETVSNVKKVLAEAPVAHKQLIV